MKIFIPNNFQQEREYIVDILLGEFLGIHYEKYFHDQQDYEIVLSNEKKITVKDHFFSLVKSEKGYLQKSMIPKCVLFSKNNFTPEKDIPIIYGTSQMDIEEEKIVCGIDIFASSFFMVTRWEEYVKSDLDSYNRFPATSSLAYQHNFLDRPVVNEYVEMLWYMMKFLGEEQKRRERSFSIVLTHDVDHVRLWSNWKDVARTMLGDLILRKNLSLFFSRWKQYFDIKNNLQKDPYDTFDELMDYSELLGIPSRFYLMNGGLTSYDNHYRIDDPDVQNMIQKIKDRGHIIGFHPSFNSYRNSKQWQNEKRQLEELLKVEVKEGRQHYLRFHVPETWRIWEQNGMEMDMTLGYPEREGFRCGCCYAFSVFDVVTRKKLNLKESPLIIMETTFEYTDEIEPEIMWRRINQLKEKVQKYKGNFVLLWHNSNLNHGLWRQVKDVYFRILK
ncbi:hypothetical protein HNQ94_001746 [Salirhabdus euzebyi]|uniref:DUF7033 domain-containing protein n=1 Tax=Salirhabdus euzebyi TaxID=394506 RepID=A0A841Q4H7_9BACI|nr:polysaccharide deacetylase family protein [Salirhabdus euzebyi]MBB6453298.1 hypothetical protein [Salirhabdus euzebyi]